MGYARTKTKGGYLTLGGGGKHMADEVKRKKKKKKKKKKGLAKGGMGNGQTGLSINEIPNFP